MSIPATGNLRQATDPTKTAGLVINWARGVSSDAVASAIGLDRVCILRAVDIGVRRGWLLTEYGERVLTFPARQGRPLPPAEPSTLPRRAP